MGTDETEAIPYHKNKRPKGIEPVNEEHKKMILLITLAVNEGRYCLTLVCMKLIC